MTEILLPNQRKKESNQIDINQLLSLRKGGRNESIDIHNISSVILVGSSGTGKSTLQRAVLRASRLDIDLVDAISVPERVVTRSRRVDDGEEVTHATNEEFNHLVKDGKLGLFGIKKMEGGREEKYGYTLPKKGTLPIFFANNGIVKNPELVEPHGILDHALLIAIYAPDEERKRRVIERSPEIAQNTREFAFRFSNEESSSQSVGKVHIVIDNFGVMAERSTDDLLALLKQIVKAKQNI